jgi:hypothetical protein
VQLNLDANEVAALLNVLNSYIPQLREEIGKTEKYEMREELKADEQTLVDIVTKLGGSVTGDGGSKLGTEYPPWR